MFAKGSKGQGKVWAERPYSSAIPAGIRSTGCTGVWKNSRMEAVQEFAKCLEDLNWFRYLESDIMLGTAVHETA